ncbi:LLM class F420-dependent oxidoreductase [Nakamurella silvestris]|nr:LLM class F420-dependent oxidoreductase [Nakamurella silvestris]
MQLGLNLGYFTSAEGIEEGLELAVAAEDLGYDVVWVAEAYGSDAPSVLSAIACRTSRIEIGAAIMQIPARAATMTAMTAATLDAISGGRFRLGLGVSGPQVSEGWYGVPYADPLGRTREYLSIVRNSFGRRRVIAPGPHFPLPLPDGPGKPLMLSIAPKRQAIPIYLAAVGPKNLALAGEIADGWHGIFFDPESGSGQISTITEAALAAGRDPAAFDFGVSVGVSVGPDVAEAAAVLRPNAALYVGGMGSREQNFYHRIATNMGFGTEADEVQRAYLSRDYAGAAAAVPLEFLDRTSLIGPVERIAERLGRYAAAGITTVNVGCYEPTLAGRIATLEATAEAAARANLRSN